MLKYTSVLARVGKMSLEHLSKDLMWRHHRDDEPGGDEDAEEGGGARVGPENDLVHLFGDVFSNERVADEIPRRKNVVLKTRFQPVVPNLSFETTFHLNSLNV